MRYRYCSIHGKFHDPYDKGCPSCQKVEFERRFGHDYGPAAAGLARHLEAAIKDIEEQERRRKLTPEEKAKEKAELAKGTAVLILGILGYIAIGLAGFLGLFLGEVTQTGHMPPISWSWGGALQQFLIVLLWPLASLIMLISLFGDVQNGHAIGWFVGLFASILICSLIGTILKSKNQKSKG